MKQMTKSKDLIAAIIFASVAVLVGTAAICGAADPLLRFPDVHGDSVVFVHGEDIWTASTDGGRALRLTDDEGEERHPKFSPDGGRVAFTAEIQGNPDVWVMNADGSDLRRSTFHPLADEVVGWHPTKNKVMFLLSRNWWSRFDRLFLIGPDGRGLEELPLHEAGAGLVGPTGRRSPTTVWHVKTGHGSVISVDGERRSALRSSRPTRTGV